MGNIHPTGVLAMVAEGKKDAEGQAGTLGVWHLASVLPSLLAFLKACGLPLSNKSLDELLKNLPYWRSVFPS